MTEIGQLVVFAIDIFAGKVGRLGGWDKRLLSRYRQKLTASLRQHVGPMRLQPLTVATVPRSSSICFRSFWEKAQVGPCRSSGSDSLPAWPSAAWICRLQRAGREHITVS